MIDVFNESDSGTSAPGMLVETTSAGNNFSDYRYRVQRFAVGGAETEDECSAMEALLTRSIAPDRGVVIVERKDSISATTGVYTCVIIYLEKRNNQGE